MTQIEKLELAIGIEPTTHALQVHCSTVEPRQHIKLDGAPTQNRTENK